MTATGAELQAWLGMRAQDPYGEPLGVMVEVLNDRESGTPEWLVLADDGARDGRLVPVHGIAPTGRQIRIPHARERIEQAPTVRIGEPLGDARKREAAIHYGQALDESASSSGLLRPPAEPATAAHGPGTPRARATTDDRSRLQERTKTAGGPSPEVHTEVVSELRAAHAMEQAMLKLLAAMRWRSRDEELVHDLLLYHGETNEHAERVRLRLDELDAPRARPADWVGKFVAYVQAQLGRLRTTPEPADLAQAAGLAGAQEDFYTRLAAIADRGGDLRTSALARSIRDDAQAFRFTLEGHRLRADPGAARGHESPFETPPELSEVAPTSSRSG